MPYWQTVKKATEEKATKISNIDITYLGPTMESDINTQISIIETCIAYEYDAIILASAVQMPSINEC
ncbi:MAG: hypothetical protein ATN31_06665 [Candidatus Epulonipiscioides saccharophilum]|nr:MAG: hypothetical protein ATN31_06665 [Epulopiscium sp. AS2M-Bin001]